MVNRITMGNDEFILYIRKNYPGCGVENKQLGKRIWAWIQDQDPGAEMEKNGRSAPCWWGDSAKHLGDKALPKTATQFTFQRQLLPALYDLLDRLGAELET